jgi:hypothetical protein
VSLTRTVPDTGPGQHHYLPDEPAPRQLAAYYCVRGHDFEVTFAAGAALPQAFGCRCGAVGQLGGQEADDASAPESEHARRLAQLRERRTLAELEQLLGDRLAERAAARKASQL